MSYQVLARKWRPQNFKEMVGQEHVLRALMNALDSDRLHHAYLFTGTRGVGKTTIARILAKCFNCETGITSTPCGECNSCREIAAGNFLDLIEVDAASRTKVEDTRELLENVQYAPTRARFKVYLIDEVHMLTGHSFNALLKTLEEPPPHVKFLFATTDPQKLPATILSRCLQFNLKRMPVDMISGHLQYLLKQETINFEESSLRLLSRAADGSMRDALSLLDQAIAFSGAELTESSVRDMLGTISHEPLIDLLELILAADGANLLQRVEDLSSVTPDFDAATDALISLLHQLAVQQVVPNAINDEDSIRDLANKITKEEVQLFYQIALQGRRDLPLSPDPRSGFEMLLLRMMSFRPLREGMQLETSQQMSEQIADVSKKKTVELKTTEIIPPIKQDVVFASISESNKSKISNFPVIPDDIPSIPPFNKIDSKVDNTSRSQENQNGFSNHQDSIPPWEDIPPELEEGYISSNTLKSKADLKNSEVKEDIPVSEVSVTVNPDKKSTFDSFSIEELLLAEDNIEEIDLADSEQDEKSVDNFTEVVTTNETVNEVQISENSDQLKPDLNQPWYAVVPQLQLSGRANELIKHCLLDSHKNDVISLILNKDSEDLLADTTKEEIQTALINFYGDTVRLKLSVAKSALQRNTDKQNETPAQRNERKILEIQQQAEHNIETDPFVVELQSRFGAKVVPGSVRAKKH